MTDDLSAMIQEFKALLENGDHLDPDTARRLQLALSIDTHTEVKRINGRLKKVEAVVDEVKMYPSLWWLLRHRTRNTIALIVFMFVLLSVFFVSEIRAPIMDWLGLPPILP
jgi:hypothetical protein